MTERNQYFVAVDTEDIRDMSIPGNGTEYEIYANSDEIKEIETLFMAKNKNAKQAVKFLSKPFDEWGADDERNEYDQNLVRIYQKIYHLGTIATKKKIEEIGLFKQ
ncbi:hypothetical protein CFK37_15735 [Virgibacillus phasianinus]|uniref:Uncharacterized protein n=1 Tax=Virgibacillus phasianinus TaxID=2017483 RepID=A0A220U697_9BACI|nr:hypothetical protein [Virgibacillus phasianinus]ASK63502.1 hypothetical protein CFK37_15735 [Virgibacillus phasianinus]